MITSGETVIFDLDGTLVDSSGFEDGCYKDALREVLGDVEIHDDWSGYRHVTDVGILTQLVDEQGIADTDEIVDQVRESFVRRVKTYLDNGGSCSAIPGARETVAGLVKNGYRVGIATGGWRHTAEMKLDRAGFGSEGLVLSSCDDAQERTRIMTHCLVRLGGDGNRVVYFGDGPWDQQATTQLGWRFIGVGPRLSGRCDDWIADFTDPAWCFGS